MSDTFNEKELEQALSKMAEESRRDSKRMSELKSNIALQDVGKSANSDSETSEVPTAVDYQKAIADLYDMSERIMINFFVLGDLARIIREGKDQMTEGKLQIGFPVRQLTPEVKSLFKTWGFEETKYGYKYFYTPPIRWHIHIPVEIRVYKRHYTFFDNPDFGFFGTEKFNMPNPFSEYWKARKLIQ